LPRICEFYGIVIYMYYGEHGQAHFHAIYSEHQAIVAIRGLRVIEGSLPVRALAFVKAWGRIHTDELNANWDLARQGVRLRPIDPLA
jgi:hypothetical protein